MGGGEGPEATRTGRSISFSLSELGFKRAFNGVEWIEQLVEMRRLFFFSSAIIYGTGPCIVRSESSVLI